MHLHRAALDPDALAPRLTQFPKDTERLLLEPITTLHEEDLLALDSDPAVMRYILDGSIRDDREVLRKRIVLIQEGYEKRPGYGLLAAREKRTGNFIGWVTLQPLDGREEIEVGYRLAKAFWGQGYATELGRELMRHGWETMGLQKIVGITHPENKASQRVLEKLGLERVGTDQAYGMDVLRFEATRPARTAF